MQIWTLSANLTCIYICMFGRNASNYFPIVFSKSPVYYSEKIWCICSVHDLAFWYADAQPCISSRISVATAFTNYVTMYNLLSEKQIRLKLGLGPKNKITAINLLTVSAFRFVSVMYTAGKGSGKYALASRNGFPSHGGWLRWAFLIGVA